MHTHMHAHTQTRTCTHAHTHKHTPVTYQGNQGNETEEKVFKKRKVFKEDLKELTEVEWRTETGSWFQITDYMMLFPALKQSPTLTGLLVTQPSVYIHDEILWFSVFFNEKPDL